MRMLLTLCLLLVAASALGWNTNLIPNSSFEIGPGRGWMVFKNSGNDDLGNINFVNEQLTNNTAVHGGWSYILPIGARFNSRSFFVQYPGTYTLSWYQKSLDGGTHNATFAWVSVNTNIGPFVNSPTIALSGTWNRASTNVTISASGYYCAHIGANGAAGVAMYLDAIQFETGTVATAYSPNAEIECGIKMGGIYGMFFTGNTPSFDMMFRNEGASTNARAEYRLYDVWNSNYLTHSFSIPIPAATNTSTNVTLPRNGWVRAVTRLYDVPDSMDECHTIVYNFPSNTVAHGTNDWLGGHPHVTRFHALRDSYAGRRIARSLSPGFRNTRWWSTTLGSHIEETRGSMVYDPAFSYTNWQQSGLIGLGCLTPQDTLWTPWAVTSNDVGQTWHTNTLFPYIGMWDGMAWSNYCYWTTLTNKNSHRFVEVGPNEPFQTGPDSGPPHPDFDERPPNDIWIGADNLPINTKNPTNFAKITKFAIDGITNADRTVKIVAIAGASGDGLWAYMVWTNMSANIQSWVYAVSNHRYQNDHGFDPNDPFYLGLTASSHHPMGWMDHFKGVRPVWNTESSTVGPTYMQGLNALFNYNLISSFGSTEASRSEQNNRQLTTTIAASQSALRDIGFGYYKFFWYSSRSFNAASHALQAPAASSDVAADQNHVDRPELVSLSIARHMVDAPGYGPISNANHLNIEMYMFTNATRGWSVAVVWSADRLNRTMGLSNAFWGTVDIMGNLGTTNTTNFYISRTPTYIVSGTLSVPQLSNTLKFATATVTADVIPPRVSFDIAPTGQWSGDTNKQLFKWTAIDDIAVAWDGSSVSKTNVLYKWKLNGGTYTPYSQSNHCWIANIPAGTNTFWVTAKDKSGNAGEFAYEFSPSSDTPMPPPAGTTNVNVINVSYELNVGTIIVP